MRGGVDAQARRVMLGGLVIVMCSVMCGVVSCMSQPRARTTFLNSADLVNMTDQMAASFAHDPVISSRSGEDEPWVISIYRVVNHTNQIMPERERWMYIGRLRALLAQTDVAEQRNLVWIVPPERWPLIAEELGVSHEPYGLRMKPTHQLTAEFYTLTHTSAAGRSDAYMCSFQLLDLRSGAIAWEDSWEVKRAMPGLTFD